MSSPIEHAGEAKSNADRAAAVRFEPKSLRTFTPTQAVLSHSAGIFHWTPEGKRLYDFTSGVLVANLGHNPTSWMKRFGNCMGWSKLDFATPYFNALPMTAYNAVTSAEVQ